MTEDEIERRALEAASKCYGSSVAYDGAKAALRDLDKPVPDPWEEWRAAVNAYYENRAWPGRASTPFNTADRETIAGLKAARSLMPKEG